MADTTRGEADWGELHWSYGAILQTGSEAAKAAVQAITGGYRPGTDPRTGKLYKIEWGKPNHES